ncbi:SET domain-containing protein-lysine N-methyltransferase [Candidatus Albibeggiatoa sp. nov. NOAA]|uniref:SET domain-containing protein-lysine N-methyltransferase n=1 Tax=Candidatus Albibeggiatoa sp. nov. NOAA TaxID=3162724 RepID=UPI0032F2321E|nr:SET domain-containing protein-lysine N-methyltransferase [Thiotrichaceae bacterium]
MITVHSTSDKGRGVVATTAIEKGTLIERAPVASFPAEQRPIIDSTNIAKYYFVLPSEYKHNKHVNGHFVFGLLSLCNHSEVPNAYINWEQDNVGLWAQLIALQDIQKGQEVSLFYTNVDEYSFNSGVIS